MHALLLAGQVKDDAAAVRLEVREEKYMRSCLTLAK